MKPTNSVFRIGLLASLILMISPAFMKPDARSYEELWKQVDVFMQKGLPRSALELIDVVQQKALAENNGKQLLKASIYRFSANQQFEEDHLTKAITFAQSQLVLLKEPEKQLLQSVLAELYWSYCQNNRFRLLERSTILDQRPDDLKEWDMHTLRSVIAETYAKSLENSQLLFNEKLADYADLLILPDKTSIDLQPSLYDFLAHRAMQFYLSAEAGLKVPGPPHGLDNNDLFADAERFIKLQMSDSEDDLVKAIKLLQQLTSHHLANKDTTALVYNEIFRLDLAFQHYHGNADKTLLYESGLSALLSRFQDHPASADVAFTLASYLMSTDTPAVEGQDEPERFKLSEALKLYEQASASHPGSRGAANCMVLKAQILAKSLGVTVQRVNSPAQAIPALLNYRNVIKPAFRLVSIESEALENIMGIINRDQRQAAMLALPAMKTWELELPFEEDYRSHSLVFNITPLEPGLYLLLASTSASFSNDDIIEYASFQVSSLSFISSKRDGVNYFYLLDRETGNPVRNATIRVMSREYDYNRRRYSVEQRMELTSARDGSFSFGSDDSLPSNRSFYIEAETKTDRLYSDNYFDLYKPGQPGRKQIRTWFFTDRAIYRPGQPIYFKGIVLERLANDYSILSGNEHIVKFYDANGQEISSLTLRTNEYGSFEGSFIAPLGSLTGEMRIADNHGSVSVSVEEYKRPTFEVKLKMPEGQYRLNDPINIKGEALAYAGYPIDSVGFTYRVYREPFYPWRHFWIGIPPFGGERVLIASGESFTRTDGSFDVDFTATADRSINKRFEAAYNYTVVVDVTDRSGETRSGSQSIRVGTKALVLSTDLTESVENIKLAASIMKAANLMGEAVATDVNITVFRIDKATRLLRPSLWPLPDRHYLGKDEFEALFPMDSWDNRDDVQNRKRTQVYSANIRIDGQAEFLPAESATWADGEYLLVAKARDVFGEEVELTQVFTLFNRSNKALPANTFSWFNTSKAEALPGETVHFSVGTACRNTQVLIEIFSNDKLIESKWIRLTNEKHTVSLKLEEKHRGMLRFQATAIRFNRTLSQASLVKVPYTNRILDIELITKRDKLTPGAAETWELKITGHNKEAVAAELLASMYDSSLDQFKPNNWYFDLLSYPAPHRSWTADNGFLTYRSSNLIRQPVADRNVMMLQPPQLNWFGFYAGYWMSYNRRGGIMMMKDGAPTDAVAEVMLMDVVDGDAAATRQKVEDDTGDKVGQTAEEAQPAQRTNFNETAFFYPRLNTGADGSVSISFTLPDALTRWRLMLLAHTKDLKTGMQEYNFTASKELMIVPNTTRFYREGDTAWVAARIVNMGDQTLTGIARLDIFDPFTGENLPYISGNLFQKPFVSLMPGRSQDVRWKIEPGDDTNLINMRFAASANGFTDSEEQFIPILPRKVLITETMPLYVKGGESKEFFFESLKENPGRKNHLMRIDFSSNPVWYAIQALPYLHEEGAENVHSIFNRFYANTLASHIANSIPAVMQVIESWKMHHPEAFMSELEKNAELKSVLLSETPWVMQARSESERKRNIVLLFDLNRMRYEQQQSINKLGKQQLPNGAWPWFRGMRESRFITQTVVTGFGRLQYLGLDVMSDHQLRQLIARAIEYLDRELLDEYKKIREEDKSKPHSMSPLNLNYLYARSFFMDIRIDEAQKEAIDHYLSRLEADWLNLNVGMQAMAVAVLNRFERSDKAAQILASLRERALHHDEFGTYWRQTPGYFWHQTPVEAQVWLIEALTELGAAPDEIDGLRTWLLSQKRTTSWNTGRATADAVYALLMRGTDWTSTKTADVKIGGIAVPQEKLQAGTGFLSHQWKGEEVNASMAEISISNPNKGMAWGGVYLQYFENIDNVKGHATPLKIQKSLFVKRISEGREVLVPLNKKNVSIGDEVVVRLTLEVDREMEFVHLKDERAAAFEPVDVLSGYNWRDGLGYYQSTRDASTDFFFANLFRGKYVFEYSLRASHAGDFAAGLARIQCLYAPEFSSHSAGGRVVVVD